MIKLEKNNIVYSALVEYKKCFCDIQHIQGPLIYKISLVYHFGLLTASHALHLESSLVNQEEHEALFIQPSRLDNNLPLLGNNQYLLHSRIVSQIDGTYGVGDLSFKSSKNK